MGIEETIRASEKRVKVILDSEIHPQVDISKRINVTTSPFDSRIPFGDFVGVVPPAEVLTRARFVEIFGVDPVNHLVPQAYDAGLSGFVDVSSKKAEGIHCLVTTNVLVRLHYHTGTHMDEGLHAGLNVNYDPRQITGPAYIVDVREFFEVGRMAQSIVGKSPESILLSVDHITEALEEVPRDAHRLLLRATPDNLYSQGWTHQFLTWSKDAAEYVLDNFPHLVAVGTDAPSTDGSLVSVDHAHHTFMQGAIRLIEGLRFDKIPEVGIQYGVLDSSPVALQTGNDATGLICYFHQLSPALPSR